jgi:hypothetical protein
MLARYAKLRVKRPTIWVRPVVPEVPSYPGDPWIHVSNGYFEVHLSFPESNNVLFKTIAKLL